MATWGTAARHGVLIKGGVYVEALARARVVVLDKTGTLTHGEPVVTEVWVARNAPVDERTLIAVAAGLEARSEHPLARAVLRYAESRDIAPAPVEGFQAWPGVGGVGRVQGREVYIGSLEGCPAGWQVEEAWFVYRQREGKTVIVVGDMESLWGALAVQDTLRASAARIVAQLHALGIERVMMLTGDHPMAAQRVAEAVGIDEVHAGLKPEDKAAWVRRLVARYGGVVMVGDGVNDAPALAEATVGVAMGVAGTDVALETADVALMADDLAGLVYALSLARRARRVIDQNLALAGMVMFLLALGAVLGWFSLPVAVLGHEIGEFAVIASGLRMLRG